MKLQLVSVALLGACAHPGEAPVEGRVGEAAAWSIADMRVSATHSMELGSKLLAVAPHAGWIGVQPDGQGVIARDLFGAATIAPPGATAVTFREPHGEAWFLMEEGGALACALEAGAPPVPVALGHDLDAIAFAPGGRALIGHDRGADTLVLLRVDDRRACKLVRRFEGVRSLANGRPPSPPCAFSADGTLAAFAGGRGFAQPETSERRTGLGGVVVDTATGEIVQEFSPYVASRAPGFAFAGDRLAHGRRVTDHRWAIDLVGPGARVTVDADTRGGHFIDLVAQPSGRWLAEGDFEDRRPRIHDLLTPGGARELSSGKGIALTFVQPAGEADPVLLVGARDGCLRAIGTDGEVLMDEHAGLCRSLDGQGQVDGAVTTADGRAIAVTSWHSAPGSTTIHRRLRVLVEPGGTAGGIPK